MPPETAPSTETVPSTLTFREKLSLKRLETLDSMDVPVESAAAKAARLDRAKKTKEAQRQKVAAGKIIPHGQLLQAELQATLLKRKNNKRKKKKKGQKKKYATLVKDNAAPVTDQIGKGSSPSVGSSTAVASPSGDVVPLDAPVAAAMSGEADSTEKEEKKKSKKKKK